MYRGTLVKKKKKCNALEICFQSSHDTEAQGSQSIINFHEKVLSLAKMFKVGGVKGNYACVEWTTFSLKKEQNISQTH